MEHNYYLPPTDLGKVSWLGEFSFKLPSYATILGIPTGTVTSVQDDNDYFAQVTGVVVGVKDYLKTVVAYRDALRDGSAVSIGTLPLFPTLTPSTAVTAGIFDRITLLVKNIKSNPNYTTAIGQDLGIIGTEIDPSFGTIKPALQVRLKDLHAYLSWKHEHTKATDIQADYGDGAGFVSVGRILSTHYLDAHLPAAGQTKIFKFKIRYVVDDEQVGVWSDEVSITVTGA
jgi:hypothetical protein